MKKLFILAALLVAPAAYAAPVTQVDCAQSDRDLTECIVENIDHAFEAPKPIAQVVYAASNYFIMQDAETGRFILARDLDRSDSPKRGDYVYARAQNDGIDFRVGTRNLTVAGVDLKTKIIETGMTASEVAAAYVAK